MTKRRPAKRAAPPLTPYKAEQVRKIADWQREKPGFSRYIVRRLAAPFEKLTQQVIPDRASQWLMETLNAIAEQLVEDHWVLSTAAVSNYDEIKSKPLEFCDALADRAILEGRKLALGVGAATGTGGLVTTAMGIPALLTSGLRVIHRVAQCYGYSGEGRLQREIMLHILALSTASTPEDRLRALSQYQRQVQSYLIDDAVHDAVMATLQRLVLGTEAAGSIPGVGIVVNAYLHRSFVQRAGIAAQRVFQESWLRDRYGLGWIDSAA
ncbi:MAG: EcsC family protein [Methylococcaceae bacterium]|nr:EcsC family protein [Methylococcaceae bacterium]